MIGPVSGKKGGATVAFGHLIRELRKQKKDFILIDTVDSGGWVGKFIGLLKNIAQFKRHINDNTIISLHASNFRAFSYTLILDLFARRNNSKLFIRLFGGNYHEYIENKPRVVQKYMISCYKRNTLMLETKGMIREFEERFDLDNIIWFPNSRPRVAVEHSRGHHIKNKKGLKLIYAGHIKKQKGIDHIISIAQYAQVAGLDIEIHLFGEIVESEFEEQIKQFDQKYLIYHGIAEPDEIYEQMQKSDLLLFPSVEGEGYPGVLIEAINLNLPAAATRLKYNSELIEDGVDGILYDENRPEQIVEIVKDLYRNPDKIEQLRIQLEKKDTKYYSDYWNGEYFNSLINKN